MDIKRQIRKIVERSLQSARRYNYLGYDPYDGLNSSFYAKLENKALKISIIQFNRLFPFNLRRLQRIRKGVDIKGLGIFALSNILLYQLTGKNEYIAEAKRLLTFLEKKSLKSSSGNYCWSGHYFPVEMMRGSLEPNKPEIISSVMCGNAFLEYYRVTGSSSSLKIVSDLCEFICQKLFSSYESFNYFKYYEEDKDRIVYNATAVAVSFLYDCSKIINYDFPDLVKISDSLISKQKSSGYWNYSLYLDSMTEYQQVDFHQGYILESLRELVCEKLPSRKINLEKGLKFYVNEQYLPNGQSKYRWPKVWPVDVHNQAQGIITLSKYVKDYPEYNLFLSKTVEYTIKNMYDRDGFFYYQKWPFFTNKIPFMRWNQAWMTYAFAVYLISTQ